MGETRLNYNLDNLGLRGMLVQTLYQQALDRGLHEFASHEIRSEATMKEVSELIPMSMNRQEYAYMPVAEHERTQWQARYFDLDDLVIFVGVANTYNWDIMGAARDRQRLDAAMKALYDGLPVMKSKDPNIVPVNFWSLAPNGVVCRTRRITVPAWDDVHLNYAGKTRKGLEDLMGLWPPLEDNGRLLLWHGVPGTGKSYGIRSLAQSWQKWCEVNYIVDPEKFFGNADYMLQVILQAADSSGEATEAPPIAGGGQDNGYDPKAVYTGHPWSLLIMEDSDEFLTADAKERSGQSMSRLLNLTSGFIGQGLNVLVLITTNEPLEHVHKALQREGRCMANVEFGPLNASEAQLWAAGRGDYLAAQVEAGEHTIADLYAMTRSNKQVRTGPIKKPMGFGVRP